jgi:exosortase/archaeosortase family protein
VLALFILFFTPPRLSWYFWVYRMDLLAFPLTVAAAGFIFLGYQQVLRAWQAFALVFLVWPYPAVRLQQLLSDPMTRTTVWVAHRAVDFASLPYEIDGGVFTSTHLPEGETFAIELGQVCSGSALTIGFLLVGTVVCCLMRGPLMSRLRWLLLGTVLAYALNLVRVGVLLAVAAHVSEGFALEVLHPVLGLVLFALLVMGMLFALHAFGLELAVNGTGSHVLWEPAEGGGRALRGVQIATVAVASLIAMLALQVQQYAFIGVGDGAPAIDVTSERTILPQVEGWQLQHVKQIAWSDLFGASSRGDIFLYQYPAGPAIVVQVVVADSKATIDRYSLEQCTLFHRGTIEALQYVSLPHGATGVLLHDTYEGVPSSTLYWEQPVRVGGETRDARIALLLDVQEPTKPVDASTLPQARSISGRLGVALTTRLQGEAVAADDPRALVDLELTELASKVIETMVRTGGPAAGG